MPDFMRRTRVISVTGGKGGVGKSSIAANLAVLFGRKSQVLILDADVGMADLNLLLGVAPDKSMLDVLDGERAERVLVPAHGIHLLPACNASTRLANMGENERQSLFSAVDVLADRFDTLVVDCAAGIHANTIGFAAAAADIIVVVTPDPTSLADAYACVKVLNKEHHVKRLYLLPNGVRSQAEATGVVQRVTMLAARFLDVSLYPLPPVPFDPMVRMAGTAGIPWILSAPDSPASRALMQVARRLDSDSLGDDRAGAIRLFWKKALQVKTAKPGFEMRGLRLVPSDPKNGSDGGEEQ
ncbi:MAG: P-loop NTPase [Deltaproteobacteria bacterium]|nr:P-loop NTPase [Deltaproteobacteria bacterium]